MKSHVIAAICAFASQTVLPWQPSVAQQNAASESRVLVDGASLYARTVGDGTPLIVLHGGPDFDHAYLLPDLDRLGSSYRVVYYDQRGRGRSANGVAAEDVTLTSEMSDLDAVRRHVRVDRAVLLAHSWGTVLALEYALRFPERVSHLVLMNPAPASAADYALLRTEYLKKIGTAMARQRELLASPAYVAGDPATVADRYRIHFKPAFARTEGYERLMATMRSQFLAQGSEGILKARAVEDRLMAETWLAATYDLLPKLRTLRIPTLVIYGDHDFIAEDISAHIAAAVPGAQRVTLADCGHFAYLECNDAVRRSIDDFMKRAR